MRPLPVSHSSLDKFETCPRQYHEVKVIKRYKDTQGVEALWGDYVHVSMEHYLKGDRDLPHDLTGYKPYLDAILAQEGTLHVELSLAINKRLEVCGFDDPDVFIRGYADFVRIRGNKAWAGDHKTGKQKFNSKQMKLMALLIFYHFPEVDWIRVGFFWLKVDKRDTDTFIRGQLDDLWGEFMPSLTQYRQAFKEDVWQPRQSGLCYGFCPVTQCEFWKPKRNR